MKKILFLLLFFLFSAFVISCKSTKTYTVTFLAQDGGYISGLKEQKINKGESAGVVKAIPNEDYRFVSWDDGDTNDKKIIENVEEDVKITAIFKKIIYEYPSIYIITEDFKEITSKEDYLNCIITVNDQNNPNYCLNDVAARIKGRGNSTWGFDKKPYRIKFNENVDLFGNGNNKDWTLIANYVDPSQIRNYLAYSIGSSFDDLPYTTTTQFVNLYVNSTYRGLYLVCEQIETGKNRVEIDVKIDNKISFLLELDNKYDENDQEGLDYFWMGGQPYSIKAPKTDGDDFNESECKRIKDYLEFCLNTLKNKKYEEVDKIIDVNSFADGYIIHELFSSIDVNYTSWYLSKDKDGLLTNAPIWDFDISCGNVDYNDEARYPNTLFAKNNTWYKYLLRHDEFRELVKEKLNKYYDMIHNIIDLRIAEVEKYESEYLKNFERWKTLGIYTWPNPKEIVAIKTWDGQVSFVREWLFNKLDYMMAMYCK